MKIYITGTSGTGKTTIARALAAKGIATIDTDEICYWQNKETGERVEFFPIGEQSGMPPEEVAKRHATHNWICDTGEPKRFLDAHPNAVAVGGASNHQESLHLFDKLFALNANPETITKRIRERTDNDFGKHPEELKLILGWAENYVSHMKARGATILDADRPLEEIVEQIAGYLS